jgi:hypothetical protein
MTESITDEGVAVGLENVLDRDFLANGQECVFEFAESSGSVVSVIEVDENGKQHPFVLTVESAAD